MATRAACDRFEADGPPSLKHEAQRMRTLGPADVAKLAAQLGERIDVPQHLRVIASQLHARAQGLNPGQRGEASTGRGRKGTGVEGWWTVPPLADTKANRPA